MKGQGKYILVFKISGEVLSKKLKSRGFRVTSLSSYDFSTLYITLLWQNIRMTLNPLVIIISHFVAFLNIASGNIVSFYGNYTGIQG